MRNEVLVLVVLVFGCAMNVHTVKACVFDATGNDCTINETIRPAVGSYRLEKMCPTALDLSNDSRFYYVPIVEGGITISLIQQRPAEGSSSHTSDLRFLTSNEEVFVKVFEGIDLYIRYVPGIKFYIRCVKPNNIRIDDPNLPSIDRLQDVRDVEIHGCMNPLKSYSEALKARNFTVSTTLRLRDLSAYPPLNSSHFRDLPINELIIETRRNEDKSKPAQPFLDYVPGLRTLKLNNVVLEPEAFLQLPTRLEVLELEYANLTAAQSKLGNNSWIERLRSLRTLKLREEMTETTHKFILPNFGSLKNLTTVSMLYIPLELSSLDGKFNDSSIKYLLMRSCGLTNLPESLFEGANFTTLNISSNHLSVTANVFSPLKWLTELNIENSQVDSADFINIVSSLPRLETLNAKENPLGSLCSSENGVKVNWPPSLRYLYLKNTNATRICPEWVENNQLIYLDLNDNNIRYINFNDLKAKRNVVARTVNVTIDLMNNPNLGIINVALEEDFLPSTSNPTYHYSSEIRPQVLLRMNHLKCDYNSYLLHELVRSSSWLKLEREGIYEYYSGDVVCRSNDVFLKECSSWWRPRDNVTVVECEHALPRAPRWPPGRLALHMKNGTLDHVPHAPLVELHAANNNITILDEDDIPSTLMKLNLSYNHIENISESAAFKLNVNRANLSVYLKGNRLTCDCSNVHILDLLKDVVRDFDDTECTDDIKVLDKLHMLHDSCEVRMSSLLLALPFTVLFLLTVILISLRLKPQIRQLFFRLGCGRCFINAIKYDDNLKDVDVFLSYAYADIEYLIELRKGLERHGYSTLEHNRDWLPGEAIINQISKSVERSRWTLLLVSDNYANSKWAVKEFHAAHGHALKYQTARVLVVLYDLHHPEKLPLDLQLYIKYNTYVNRHDEKFWQKLCNSMPIIMNEKIIKDQQNDIPLSPV